MCSTERYVKMENFNVSKKQPERRVELGKDAFSRLLCVLLCDVLCAAASAES